uniref:Uncharacterized protein LOC104220348 n=1 Tax=Nicotiana sylvestris TaxID=4096 RepID=A0A1U7VT13_NICSY|nr:PREDICTED: uncharacterized protein LOC104220348 [Nicotiana sylvestris]
MVAFAQATKNRKLKNRMESEGNSNARSTGNMGESLGGGRSAFWGGSSEMAQTAIVESFQARSGQQGIPPAGSVRREIPAAAEVLCLRCGKIHSGTCYLELPICYGCGIRGHVQRHCRVSRQGAGRGTILSSSPAVATSSAPSLPRGAPAPTGHGITRGGVHSSGRPSRFYAMSGRYTIEASPDVVTDELAGIPPDREID